MPIDPTSPPWAVLCRGSRAVAVVPTGRSGEVFSVEGWPEGMATAVVLAANEAVRDFAVAELPKTPRQTEGTTD